MPYNSLKAPVPTAKLKSAAAAQYSTKAGSKCLRLFEFTLLLIFSAYKILKNTKDFFTLLLIFSAYKILKNTKDFFHIIHVNFADIAKAEGFRIGKFARVNYIAVVF